MKLCLDFLYMNEAVLILVIQRDININVQYMGLHVKYRLFEE